MRNLLRASLIASAFVTALAAAPLAAQVTVGSNAPDNAVVVGKDAITPGTIQTVAQTFTTDAVNPFLQSFTFLLSDYFGGADLLVQASIFEFAANATVGPALFTSAVQSGSSNLFGYDQANFTGVDLLLNPGTIYALLLRPSAASPDAALNFVGTTTGNSFATGQLFYSTSGTNADLALAGAFTASNANTYGNDAAVQMTFNGAPVTATPEPATLTMLATGLAGVGAAVRRRRRTNTAPAA